jgi:hypothetical protein
MTTSMTMFNAGAIPAHIANRQLSAATLALSSGNSVSKRISIEGGVFRMMVGGKEVAKNTDRSMNIAIVSTAPANSRVFYDPSVPYVRGQAAAPTCSATDGIKPNPGTKTPQASSCASCPQNVKGSGTNGTSMACRFQRRLAVVLDNDLSGDVYQIILPATSIFGKGDGTQQLPLEAYARMLHGNRVGVDSVITKMEFDTDSSTPKLLFSPVRFLEATEQEIVDRQSDTPEAEQAIGLNAYQMDTPAIAAPKAVAPVEQHTKSSGFVATPQAEDADEVEEEVIVKAKPKAKVADEDIAEPVKAEKAIDDARSAKISNVLSAWAD